MECRPLPSVEVRHYPDRILTDRHGYHQLLVGLGGCLELETGRHTVRVAQGILAPVAAGDTHHYLSPGENRVLVLDLPVAWCETLALEAALLHPGRRLPYSM
ncbi:MAG TPA: AraC family transcriptional regulator, partial [Gammaproteobacteria bacterium]|nr:AraC family transcriptional regulator [Gammaproteobacteria bacterium]